MAATATETARPASRVSQDWIMVLLSTWFLGGLYLDGWAHTHIPDLETFFTPWHGVFYAGFFAVAAFLAITLLSRKERSAPLISSIPQGYELSYLGVIIFFVGGLGDMTWHTLFGIEANIEALLSPTHLILATGLAFIVSGPLRAAYKRTGSSSVASLLPMILSATLLLSLFTFMTQFAHPLVNPRGSGPQVSTLFQGIADNAGRSLDSNNEALGITGVILQSALLMGVVLFLVWRWGSALPFGTFTFLFTLNSAGLSIFRDQYSLILIALLAGILADLWLLGLKPSRTRERSFRLFAFAVPCGLYAIYGLDLYLTKGVWWAFHIWAGLPVMAGIVGIVLSFAFIAPKLSEES
ncbi:hypothetical protein HYR53_10645 [Candidatus Acetothermia bacterium]|nr:hypothetical protein [Candidatus Acetothermia bacterium]